MHNKRDHGGDLDRAMATYGQGRWVDLSTGINPVPYPLPDIEVRSWAVLPTKSDVAKLEGIARTTYNTRAEVVALAGAQAAIQLVPRLKPQGRACVVGPTYNEHAGALEAQGWQVDMVQTPEEGRGADVLIVVNPNNPDGRSWAPERLLSLRSQVGLLVVDESFGDTDAELSIASFLTADDNNCLVMRSFGKFYGLAGLRLGFAITGVVQAARLRSLAGPWAVNGPAIAVGSLALADTSWRDNTIGRLRKDAKRLDRLAGDAGWELVGGTPLFRTYTCAKAETVQAQLAQRNVWTRIFPYSETWIRLGLPGNEQDWAQLEAAFAAG